MSIANSPGLTTRKTKRGLRAKLVRVYALQVLLISIAALVGTYITYVIVEDVLTQQALNEEAEHFWELFAQDSAQPLPDTENMKGYLAHGADKSHLPFALRELSVGFGRVGEMPNSPLVHVSEEDGRTLYLVFAEEQVSTLVFYFGLAPLLAVLLTVYVLLFLTYRLSDQAISPILNLAKVFEQYNFRGTEKIEIPDLPDDVDLETKMLADALESFSSRLTQFVDRERTFTRNAGHELRTPIAVIKGSLELLKSREHSAQDARVFERLSRVVSDMQGLLETLLLLAREEEVLGDQAVSVNSIVVEEIEMLTELAREQKNTVTLYENCEAECFAQPRVLAIIVSNLLRNAILYTEEGTINVHISEQSLAIADTGIGMSNDDLQQVFSAFYRGSNVTNRVPDRQSQLTDQSIAKQANHGQGLGLALVRRLCEQLNWRIEVTSVEGAGTEFIIFFAAAK